MDSPYERKWMKHQLCIGVIFLFLFHMKDCHMMAQESKDSLKKFEFKGYASNLQSVLVENFSGDWLIENQIHNRLNFFYYPTPLLQFSLQLRNRFIYGDYFSYFQGYADLYRKDRGFVDLNFNLSNRKNYVLNMQIDRFYAQYTIGRIEITAGRQRINWGQTLVWNPNDLFNNYSFFDFDYTEKPGSDGIRLQYYPDNVSTFETAIKFDSSKNVTAALLLRINKWRYDIQFIGGILNGQDLVIGTGWSGNIGRAAFRGEVGYYHPFRHFSDTIGFFQISLGTDYSYKNSLSLQFELLYSDYRARNKKIDLLEYYAAPLSVKNLSFTDLNIFFQASYLFTPLLNASLSFMVFPRIYGFYLGPSINYSIAENFGLSLIFQIFSGEFTVNGSSDPKRQNLNISFLRFKWNF